MQRAVPAAVLPMGVAIFAPSHKGSASRSPTSLTLQDDGEDLRGTERRWYQKVEKVGESTSCGVHHHPPGKG